MCIVQYNSQQCVEYTIHSDIHTLYTTQQRYILVYTVHIYIDFVHTYILYTPVNPQCGNLATDKSISIISDSDRTLNSQHRGHALVILFFIFNNIIKKGFEVTITVHIYFK